MGVKPGLSTPGEAGGEPEIDEFRSVELDPTDELDMAVGERRWSARRTLAFIVISCGAFWALVIALFVLLT